MTYKEDMWFQGVCLYETVKVAASERVMSSDIRWRRTFPQDYRNYHVGEQIQQRQKLTTGVELYTPSGEWLNITVTNV